MLTAQQIQDFTNKTGMSIHLNIGSQGDRKGLGIAIAYKASGNIQPNLDLIEAGVSSKIRYPDISIINFYGPHNVIFRKRAIVNLYMHVDCRTILAGDFNVVEEDIDRWSPEPGYLWRSATYQGAEELRLLQTYGNMRDYFRYENPTMREYTFSHNQGYRSRLDRFYVSVGIWDTIRNYVNKPSPTSDHNLVSIDYKSRQRTTDNRKIERGQTYWKLNNKIE